ncbi:MAG TPA: ATP-grasp domain-containing protein [Spirochaetales bacterium]|jgi:D-alanine-D-alanine ligase|nr:ATP-grasp domain-containing protein [Spirochaetales bacterium]
MHILIVSDKLSKEPAKDELDTALEVKQVGKALKALGHEVSHLDFSLNLQRVKNRINAIRPDLIFNLVETLEGCRLIHLAPALFEAMGIRFTGGSSCAMMLSSDKLTAKHLMRKEGLPTPPWLEEAELDGLAAFLGHPLIIKPVAEEASVGITDASVQTFHDEASLKKALAGGKNFAETFIQGREFSVSVLALGDEMITFEPAEMLFIDYPSNKPTIVGYEAKWEESSFEYMHTQRNFLFSQGDEQLLIALGQLSRKAFLLFGGKGYARVDFRIDECGDPFILEVNLNPCIAQDSGFVAAAQREGLSYDEMIALIIRG